jgi:hypothetical protein
MADDLHAIFDEAPAKAEPLPTMEGWPGEGIFFGMSDDAYHSIPALSASGTKLLLSSPMLYWASTKWLNKDAAPRESEYMELGKAYHARIVEGREVFYSRYDVELDPADHPNALRTMDEIRAVIDEINEALPAKEKIKKNGNKGDLVARLLQHRPDAEIWETLLAEHAQVHEGKTLLPFDIIRRIEIAAAMVEKHPQLCKAFTGGFPEVSIFWVCPESGVPMKARLDYLKTKAIVDLKSFSNQREKPVDKAIAHAVAERKYHYQVAVYQEAVEAAKTLLRRDGPAAIRGPAPSNDWIKAWLAAPPPEFLFVFQQTGIAPLARGMVFPRNLTFDIGKIAANEAKRRFAENMRGYGPHEPWLDIADIETFEDTSFPAFIAD